MKKSICQNCSKLTAKLDADRMNKFAIKTNFAFAIGHLLALVLILLPSTQADGKSIYVSPRGMDNNSGTIAQPLGTIQAAVDKANPGDTVYVHGGTYVEAVRIRRSGTKDNPITVTAYPGETPVIDGRAGIDCLNCGLPAGPIVNNWIDPRTGRGLKWNPLVSIQGNHVIFDGFIVKRSMGRGIQVLGNEKKVSNVTLRNNQVLDSRSNGILLEGDKGIEKIHIENNVVWHSSSYAPWVDGRDSSVYWGAALVVKNSNNITVRGNTVYENWGEGINVLKDSTYVTEEDNIVYDNFALQIYVDRAHHVTLQRNLVYHTNNPDWRRGGDPSPCIVVNNEPYSYDYTITNNIDIVNNIAVGCSQIFALWGSLGQGFDDFLVAHNTFVNAVRIGSDKTSRVVNYNGDDYRNFKFENNVIYQGNTSNGHEVGWSNSSVSFANNLWYPHHPENGGGSGPGDIVGQLPQFADPRAYELPEKWIQKPDSSWFRIKSSSPAIDSGKVSEPFLSRTNILIDFFFGSRDSNPDIGVHEYANFLPKFKKNFFLWIKKILIFKNTIPGLLLRLAINVYPVMNWVGLD